jgi:hypothetical protein
MMRSGQVFGRQIPVRLITDLESSLLRSPKANDGARGSLGEALALKRGNSVQIGDQVMDLVAKQGMKVSRADLLPTVTVQDGKNTGGASQFERNTKPLNTQVLVGLEWGKFALAITRWEKILGRPAPAPTKPDGKDGAHRLSSEFTEWMMGLPKGWITDCGLSRNEELKACGNGVVPAQARLALSILLDGITVEREREKAVMFPTPTVSDTFTDNLSSTQQKQGSMHSVTLPQAVRMIDEPN